MVNDLIDWSKFGSSEPFKFMKEAIEEMRNRYAGLHSVIHIDATNLERFEERVREYAEKHPEEDVKATGFIFSTKPKVSKKIDISD